jgi:hypothetical protein
LQAKKGIQHVDVPPIRSVSNYQPLLEFRPKLTLFSQTDSPGAHSDSNGDGKPNAEIYVADGDYIKDIEINDLRNRYTLTKGSTQKMVITPVVVG